MNFVDSYKYNIAAYVLAELLGLDDMLPVCVERKWKGDSGSLSWWLPVKMDEMERVKQKIPVQDIDAWNKQMYRIQVFDQLVYDSDPNELASSRVAAELIRQGYRAVALKGGIAEWLAANLPIETKEAPRQTAPEPGALKG